MAEMIPALTPVTASWIRSRKRRAGHADDFEFAHWLADEAEVNEVRGGDVPYPVPIMSTEGILILAQAHTEEMTRGSENFKEIYKETMVYEKAAEKFPEDHGQYVFSFLLEEHEAGEVVNKEI